MAHPSRARYFPHLRERLGDVPWVIDEAGEGCWPTGRRAWALHDPTADYHVVIQDDAILCENFIERATAQLIPRYKAYSFFLSSGSPRRLARIRRLLARKRRRAESRHLYNGVAVCLAVALIEPMLQWIEEREVRFDRMWGTTRDDGRIAEFILKRGLVVCYPLPSLVDHRVGKSLVRQYPVPASERVAVAFVDKPRPAKRDRVAKMRRSARGRSMP